MYAIVAHFDRETELIIKKVWSDLSTHSISKYAEEIPDRRPHITLASYKNLSLEQFIPVFDDFYQSQSKLPLTLNVLGTFFNSSALFLTPTPSLQLVNFHTQHHKHFNQYNDNPNSLYLPDRWIPHCTIANRLSTDKLEEAYTFCSKNLPIIHAHIEEVTIITTIMENNHCVSAPTVHSVSLN
ncbi:2'-5' RNA ligase family protein [Paenisporosarcina indica]|uniref:2'-5' RNA ligase family protein n=1 Tax=Paenisporosarcina indica TaxID=650093 RepID=UPI00094FF478|nr:2'-5' RNA ligase family protein [Paenisporosarcina indica]